MLTITFTVLGDDVLVRGLSRFADDCKDFSPVWPDIEQNFKSIEVEQFTSQGIRGGSQWPPLSPSYAEWKRHNFPGKPVLELTGEMKFMMTEGLTIYPEPMRLWMGPQLDRAYWHQHGTSRMPARPIVALTELDKMGWVKMIQKYLVDKATEEGLR